MDRLTAASRLIDVFLAVGLPCLTILAAAAAAIPIHLGYQTGTWAAYRWHGHRTIRDAETYLHHPQLRHIRDHFDQPRKETP